MASVLLAKASIVRAASSRPSLSLEQGAGTFLRQALCRRSREREYSTTSALSSLSLWQSGKALRLSQHSSALSRTLANARRFKSGRAKGKQEMVVDEKQLGDEPPLYDGKPAFWARWVFALLALDMLFTGFSVDMVMRNWTRLVEDTPSSASSPNVPNSDTPGERYEIRPLWQRLGLASFQVVVGAAAGALILASRDRTIWRLRIRRVPVNSLPPGRAGVRLSPSASEVQTINVLTLESGSGRTKRFLVRDCVLMPGRDLSELFLSIGGIRGRFVLSINGARVLGVTPESVGESSVMKQLLALKANEPDVALINSTPGGTDPENAHLVEFRKGLALAWISVGGTLSVPKISPQKDGWTSGPVVEGAR